MLRTAELDMAESVDASDIDIFLADACHKSLMNKPYIRTFGAPDQGQTLDVQESQTAKSALRDDWTRNLPHHTLEVVLEVTLEHMCTGLRP